MSSPLEFVEVVSATKLTKEQFWEASPLGLSLRRLAFERRLRASIAYENTVGLPDIYNARIMCDSEADVLVFIHDDVWINDFFVLDKVIDGLVDNHVIGVAGNKRRVPGQAGWPFLDDNFTRDSAKNLSGLVAHGVDAFSTISCFGRVPAPCELLDGLFLAARKSTLRSQQVFFDARFDFHFYDLDFCRTARSRWLKLSTWPISLTHQSRGAFGSASWREKYRLYMEKWKD